MRIKRFLSILLSMLMVCSIFGGLSVSAASSDYATVNGVKANVGDTVTIDYFIKSDCIWECFQGHVTYDYDGLQLESFEMPDVTTGIMTNTLNKGFVYYTGVDIYSNYKFYNEVNFYRIKFTVRQAGSYAVNNVLEFADGNNADMIVDDGVILKPERLITREVVTATPKPTEPEEKHTYTVVGDAAFLSAFWNPATVADDMTLQKDGTYKITYTGVAKSDCYTIKVAQDHAWDVCFGANLGDPNPANIEFSVPEDNSTVDIILTLQGTRDKDGVEIPDGFVKVLVNGTDAPGKVVPYETTHYVVGEAGLCNGVAWNQADETNKMTKNEDGSYEITFKNVQPKEDGSAYQFKVTTNGAWEPGYDYNGEIAPGGANAELAVTEPNSTVKIVLTTDLKVRAYVNGVEYVSNQIVALKVTPPTKTTYLKGEDLDTTGMVVYGIKRDGTKEEITDYDISGFGDSDESNVVTVKYNNLTAYFTVVIHTLSDEWTIIEEPTCTSSGKKVMYCETCDKVLKTQIIDPIDHNYTEKVVKPTCTERGYTEYTCKNCGDTYRDSYVKETGHNPITDYGKPATCTENGLTEGSHCNVCDTVLVPQKVIPKLNHSYTAQVTSVASCTTRGSVTYTCQSCGDSYVVYQDALKHDFKLSITVNPSCTTSGYKQYVCTRCNESYSEQLPTVAHTYNQKVVKPTCNSKGYTLYTCTLCGDSYKLNYVDTIDHEYKSTVAKQPTCTEDGIKKYTCTVCGDTYNESIPKTGHKFSVSTVSPTCTADGYTINTCDICGYSYKDLVISKLEHIYGSVVTKEPTCTEEGTKKYTCPTCGDTYTVKIPMIDHTVVIDKAVSATYTAYGKTEGSHCSVCGKVIKEQKKIAKKKLAKPTGVKATVMSKSFKLNWKKVAGAKGYEIQYSYKSNFSGAKKITVKSGNKTSQTVKKLTGKKKVYIRIRTYYNDKNGKAYSPWTVTNVTTKK